MFALHFKTETSNSQDRRIKRLSLVEAGSALVATLSGDQRMSFPTVFAQFGPEDEAAWRRVMQALADLP